MKDTAFLPAGIVAAADRADPKKPAASGAVGPAEPAQGIGFVLSDSASHRVERALPFLRGVPSHDPTGTARDAWTASLDMPACFSTAGDLFAVLPELLLRRRPARKTRAILSPATIGAG